MKPLWLQHSIFYSALVAAWIVLYSFLQGSLSVNEIENLNAHYGEVRIALDFQHLKKLNEQQRELLLQYFSLHQYHFMFSYLWLFLCADLSP